MKLKILKYIILIILLSYILKKKFKYQENLVNNQQSAIQKWNNATNNGTTYRGINNKSNTICVPFINNNEFYDSDVCSTQPNGIDWCATKTLATGEKDGSNWQWCSKINGTCKSGIGANADCYPRPNTNDANGYTIATCKSWNNNKNLSDAEFADVWTHSNNNLIKNNNKKYEPDFTCQPLTCPENDGVVDEGCTTARPYRSKISKHMGASDGKGKWCYNHKSCGESLGCYANIGGMGVCKEIAWTAPPPVTTPVTTPIPYNISNHNGFCKSNTLGEINNEKHAYKGLNDTRDGWNLMNKKERKDQCSTFCYNNKAHNYDGFVFGKDITDKEGHCWCQTISDCGQGFRSKVDLWESYGFKTQRSASANKINKPIIISANKINKPINIKKSENVVNVIDINNEGTWSEWSICNKRCGPGKKKRECNNGDKKCKGLDGLYKTVEYKNCNNGVCRDNCVSKCKKMEKISDLDKYINCIGFCTPND